jgi:esterase
MNLHFQHFGSGFPLVILHGLFGSSDNWQSLGKRLGEQFSIFLVDQRNHGNSPHSEEFSVPLMAADLREFFFTQNLSRAHLLGHSMGGKSAMEFALTFPDLVEKLVVVDMAPKKYARSHDDIFQAMLRTDPGKFTTRSEVDQELTRLVPEKATRYFLLKNLQLAENGKLKWKINVPALFAHYDEVLEAPPATGTFDHPTLFVRGGKSDYIRPEDNTLIQAKFSRAEVVTIAKAAHWVHADAPNEFLQVILSFLNG